MIAIPLEKLRPDQRVAYVIEVGGRRLAVLESEDEQK
jgi:hypothetical protein